MRKILLSLALLTTCWLAVTAQRYDKMSSWIARHSIDTDIDMKRSKSPAHRAALRHSRYVLAMVQTTDSDAEATLRDHACAIVDRMGAVYFAFVPTDEIAALSESPAVVRIEADELPDARLDRTATTTGADKAYRSEGLTQAFTGKGVMVAVTDIGFDFTHPTFRNPDGTSAISWFWDYMAPGDNPDYIGKIYNQSEQLLTAAGSGDSRAKFHGTHVMGITSGRGLSDGTYRGIAYESTIAGAVVPLGDIGKDKNRIADFIRSQVETGKLPEQFTRIEVSDASELIVFNTLFGQADQAGMPCVINCSWGRPQNFTDDNRLYEAVFNTLVGPGHIIVAGAGNEGSSMVYGKKEAGKTYNHSLLYLTPSDGMITLRCRKDAPAFGLTVTIGSNENAYTFDVATMDSEAARDNYSVVEGTIPDGDAARAGITDNHKVTLTAYTDNEQYRIYYLRVELSNYAATNVTMPLMGDITVTGDGEVELLGLAQQLELMPDDYLLRGNGPGKGRNPYTIGFPALLERAVAVGMMNTRDRVTNLAGESFFAHPLYEGEGHLASISSCGPTCSGLVKPDVVAPGTNIISAFNSLFVKDDDNPIETAEYYRPNHVAEQTFEGKQYYMSAFSGTSMATPVASGVIALWLQANPTLTPEDVKGVLQRTAVMPEDAPSKEKNNEYGWGMIDAYAGLLDVLGLSSIPAISKRRLSGATVTPVDGGIGLRFDTEVSQPFEVRVYGMDGRQVARRRFAPGGSVYRVDLAAVPGVYAVQVDSPETALTGSDLVRF